MIAPMLAVTLEKADVRDWNDWMIEEKFDGHRLIVQVNSACDVRAWTRPRKHAGADGKTMAEQTLPAHLTRDLAKLPAGLYDGELVAGVTSTDVRRTDLVDAQRFIVFDVLEFKGRDTKQDEYRQRRMLLEALFCDLSLRNLSVTLADARPVRTTEDVMAFVQPIWGRGGEGAMLKRKSAPYQSGKRSKDLVKIKKLCTTVCTVVGFEATRGTVMNRGPFASVVLVDAQGNRTTVKTKDDYELKQFERAWDQRSSMTTHTDTPNTAHPALGRKLRIEYQDRTRDGGYRHPRWDRWENE